MVKRVVSAFICVAVLAFCVGDAYAQKRKKIDRGIEKQTFIPKGTIFAGGTFSYTDLGAGDYTFLLFKDISGSAYLLGAKAFVGYTFRDDIGAGLSFDYSRTKVQIDNVDIKLSEDMVFAIKDYYSIQQVFTATAFLRTYINIGNSKRFGLFNDLKFSFGGGQGKIYNGKGEAMSGTYEKIEKAGLLISPGISVFMTDFMTVEASIGILGIQYSRTEQITNQVSQGHWESFDASFKINLLSVGLGVAFYF